MRVDRRGFTLTELVVVVVIIGVLAAIGIPQYVRTVESSKADDAQSAVQMIATTNRMFALDNAPNYNQGRFGSSNSGGACGGQSCSCGSAACAAGGGTQCNLVFCNYLADRDWGTTHYNLFACNPTAPAGGCCAAGLVACATRKVCGANSQSNSPYCTTAGSAYDGWGYTVNTAGVTTALGTAPAPN